MSNVRRADFGIGFLLADSSRMLRQLFNDRVTAKKLTSAQWRALVHLSVNEGLNQVQLADRLDVQPITVARLIDKLVANGLVIRQPDPRDRRAQKLFLTDAAAPMLEQVWQIADENQSLALDGLRPEEAAMLISLLTRVRLNLVTATMGHTTRNPKRVP